jgi:hypothetical protein
MLHAVLVGNDKTAIGPLLDALKELDHEELAERLSELLARKVFSLEIHDEGMPIELQLFSSHEKAIRWLAEWCRLSWYAQGHCEDENCDLSNDDALAIGEYFDFWDPQQEAEIAVMVVDKE